MSGVLSYNNETFMNSDIANGLNSKSDFMQWAEKEYITERMPEEIPEGCKPGEIVYAKETLY